MIEGCSGELYRHRERDVQESCTSTERRMFRRAVQAQREGCSGELYRHREGCLEVLYRMIEGCSGELYRHRERDVQESCTDTERDV